MQAEKELAVHVDHQIAAGQARPIVGQFPDNGPGLRVQGQRFEGLVEGEGVDIQVEVLALEIDLEAGGHVFRRRIDIALGSFLGGD